MNYQKPTHSFLLNVNEMVTDAVNLCETVVTAVCACL